MISVTLKILGKHGSCDRASAVFRRTFITGSAYHHNGAPTSAADPMQHTDYGKYYQPGTFENIYHSFVDSGLVRTVESCLTAVHDFTGLPWWATIVLCTVTLRATITAPLFVWQMKKMFKYRMLVPTLEKIAQQLKLEGDQAAKKLNWDDETKNMHLLNSYSKHQKRLFAKHKVPGTFRRFLLPWVQLPVWFSMTAALRHMTLSLPFVTSISLLQSQTALALTQEGVLWFPNLCICDPYYVLAVLTGLCNLAIIEVHRGDGKTPLVAMQWLIINLLRGFSVVLIPIACYMPSGVVLYWLTSSGFGLAQALAMQSIKFKMLLRLPVPANHSKTPYKDILSRFRF